MEMTLVQPTRVHRARYFSAWYSDGKITLTGSMNWTAAAAHNSENLNLVASPTIAAAYAGYSFGYRFMTGSLDQNRRHPT
jgi:hypothetical protein